MVIAFKLRFKGAMAVLMPRTVLTSFLICVVFAAIQNMYYSGMSSWWADPRTGVMWTYKEPHPLFCTIATWLALAPSIIIFWISWRPLSKDIQDNL